MTPTVLNLRKLRKDAGLTQLDLADMAGTRQATISGLESGRTRQINLDLLDRIAGALKCKSTDLLVHKRR